MMKISVFRSPALGSTVYLTALIFFNSGAAASTKPLHFEALEPPAIAKLVVTEDLVDSSQSVIKWKFADFQLASACNDKRWFCFGGGSVKWEDKEYPGLNE